MLHKKLDSALLKKDRIMAHATKITVQMSDDPKGKGSTSDMVGNGAIELMLADEVVSALKMELQTAVFQLNPYMDRIRDTEARTIMQQRYVKGYSVRMISVLHSYSERSVYRILDQCERYINRIESETAVNASERAQNRFKSNSLINTH